ncbi:ATP-binding protein [Seleniivibrio sp.]|uniref:ATP-binding protein n=1 Tax=Seleniivibrio sp. TaxID=2898801 RepID=UPI0025D93566|nr:ATP-binding protein [Seleniivibrio sp.]MCD8552631.1 ATP-binding protein [Seleniivibrio sp.]
MQPLASAASKKQKYYDAAMIIFLSAAGYLGNIFKFEIFFNVDFLFGSIAVMYAIKRYGKLGIIPAIIASLYTYTLWNHPYAIIIFTAEAAFVAFTRRREEDIIILDLIYWLTFGAGMVFFFYHYVMGLPTESSQIVILKQSINGITNALCGSLIYHGLNYFRKVSGYNFRRISFRQTFFKIIMLIAAIPALLYVIIGVKMQTVALTEGLKDNLNTIYNTASISFGSLTKDVNKKIRIIASIEKEHEQPRIEDNMKSILMSSDTFTGIGYVSPDIKPRVIYSKTYDKLSEHRNVDLNKNAIYRQAARSGNVIFSNLLPNSLQYPQQNTVLAVKALFDDKNKLSGYVQGSIDFKTVENLLRSVSQDSRVLLTLSDSRGKIIISTDPQKSPGQKLTFPSGSFAEDYDKRGIFLLTPCPADNISVMTKWKNAFYIKKGTLGDSGLTLTAMVPLSAHVQRVNDIGFSALKIIYIMMILCILAALFISRQVSFHLETLRRCSSELPEIVHSGSKFSRINSVFSEVSELSDNFVNISAMLSAKFSELSKQKAELALILNSIPMIIFMKDINNRFLSGNSEAAKKMNVKEEALAGKKVSELFPEMADDVYENDTKVITTKKPLLGVIQNYKLKDRTLVVKTDKIPILDENGDVAYILVISTDITDEHKAQAEKQRMLETLYQQAKMAEMGAMTAAIAHQWKQPLNTIALLTQILISDAKDESATKESILSSTDMIMKNVEFMVHTAKDFTEYFKITKEKQMFRACETISEVYTLVEPQFRKHSVTVDVHEHEHFLIYGLRNEFKQVCLNILNNAKDALVERNVENKRIDVYYENDDNFRKIIVQDNAGGIDPKLLPDKVFEIFQSTKGEKGTGLGLYISKSIIEEHMGGKITAENSDHGAKFTIFLPIDQTITKEN